MGIPESGAGPSAEAAFEEELKKTDVVMDAIFGFSFSGEPRAPFDVVIQALKKTKKPIVSVDIPSAWDVEKGDPDGRYFTPGTFLSFESVRDLADSVLLSSRRSPNLANGTEGWRPSIQG